VAAAAPRRRRQSRLAGTHNRDSLAHASSAVHQTDVKLRETRDVISTY